MNDPTTNWQTVQWFWTSNVQPAFASSGVSLATSVRAINGGLECGGNPINPQRVQYIQCFERQFGVPVDSVTNCAVGDSVSVFNAGDSSSGQQTPIFAIALVVLGTITLALAVVVVVIMVLLGKKSRAEEHV